MLKKINWDGWIYPCELNRELFQFDVDGRMQAHDTYPPMRTKKELKETDCDCGLGCEPRRITLTAVLGE